MRGSEPAGHLGVLQAAVFSDRRLRLRYRSSGQAAESSERVVDPYGLVCKAGIWYLVADQQGEPRLFRVSRVISAAADEAPVRRRDGMELAELWQTLRRQVEERPAEVAVVARVRREWLDMFRRICVSHLVGRRERTARETRSGPWSGCGSGRCPRPGSCSASAATWRWYRRPRCGPTWPQWPRRWSRGTRVRICVWIWVRLAR